MGFMKKIWKNRQSENPNRRRLTATGEVNVYDVAREEGLVLEEGDAFSDQTMNDMEDRIAAGFDETAPVAHTHTPGEVGAAPSGHTHTPGEVGASPSNHSHNLLTYTATHSKSGTVHTLTGLPTAAGIYIAQFKAVANFDAGNTFAGGYTAKPMGGETALPDKAFITGDLVSVVVDVSGKKLGFRLGGASTPKFPTYTGSHALFGTDTKGYIELYSSGTLTAQANMSVEAFLVGGGASGGTTFSGAIGGGGGSGYVKLLSGVSMLKGSQYPVVIGSGGIAATSGSSPCIAGGSTSVFSNTVLGGKTAATTAHGSDGGSGGGEAGTSTQQGGNGGRNGTDGVNTDNPALAGLGAGVTTIFNGKEYAGGGGGGGYMSKIGGLGFAGAGNGSVPGMPGGDAVANTGSGGGGAGGNPGNRGGNGGSGVIIIRWGY